MSWQLDGRPLRRVLVTRLRYLGDIAMSTVVLEVLRRGDPDLEIDYLCEAAHAPLLAGHPRLAAVHSLGIRRRGKDAAARPTSPDSGSCLTAGTRGTLGTVMALRRRRYDLAVDLFFNPRSAWLLRLAGIRARVGGATSRSRARLYTHQALAPSLTERPGLYRLAGGGLGEHLSRLAPLRRSDGQHFLDWFEATYHDGGLRTMVAKPKPTVACAESLQAIGAPSGNYTLLAPGATWRSKEWPLDHWRDLIRDLIAVDDRVVILRPPAAAERYESLAEEVPDGRGGLLDPLPLEGALAVVAAARRVVSVDGGIMHAAVAMQRPTVALFGPTDPELWFPYRNHGRFRVLARRPACHPCHLHECSAFICLPELDPASVMTTLETLPADND